MHVVLFDGVCALCDASVRWLMRVDKRRVLRYSPLQGESGRAAISRHPEADASLSTIIYVRNFDSDRETVFERSDAAFAILRDVGGVWRLLAWGRFIPRVIRDAVYDWVARHRYRWFGKFDACRLPSAGDEELFLP